MKIHMYCSVCKQMGPEADIVDGRHHISHGWRQVPARILSDGSPLFDPDAPFKILCCPKCVVKGEPSLN